MTKKINRPVTRETPDVDPMYHEVLMIKIEPMSKCLKIWQKGRRHVFAIRFQDIFRLGFQHEVDIRWAEKFKTKKKARTRKGTPCRR